MFGRRITLFEVLRFKVRIDASWLILAGLVAWGLAEGYFPALAPGLEPALYWAMGAGGVVGLAASVVLHELAHSVVARHYGMPIHGITLFLLGGVAEMDDEPASPGGEALMALAGPLMSLLLAALAWSGTAVAAHGVLGPLPVWLLPMLSYLVFINGVLAVFNMIPAFPLDGGRVLRAALWGWRGDLTWATRMAGRAGEILGLAVMLGGVALAAWGNPLGGVWWLVMGLFIRAAAVGTVRQHLRHAAFAAQPLSRFIEPYPLTVPPELPLDRFLHEVAEAYGLAAVPVVQADGRLLGRACVDAARAVPPEIRPDRCIADVVEAYPEGALIAETCSAVAAHGQMRRHGRRSLVVVRDGRLTGTLPLSRLQAFLSVHAANDDGTAGRAGGLR